MFKYWGNCVVHFFIYFIFLCYSNSLWSTGKMKSWCVSKKEKRETEGGLTGLREMSFIWYDSELYAGVPVNILTFTILWLYMCTTVTIQMKMLLPLNTDAIHWTPAVFCLFVVWITLLKLIFNYNFFFFSFFQELTCGDQVCKQIYKRTMWLNSQNEVHCVFIVSLTDIITQQKLYLLLFIF